MSTPKKSIWYNPDASYLGTTGCNSVREMAELVFADPGYFELLLSWVEPEDITLDRVEAELDVLGVRAQTLSIAHSRMGSWNPALVTVCAVDAKPGRGRIKVLGVSL